MSTYQQGVVQRFTKRPREQRHGTSGARGAPGRSESSRPNQEAEEIQGWKVKVPVTQLQHREGSHNGVGAFDDTEFEESTRGSISDRDTFRGAAHGYTIGAESLAGSRVSDEEMDDVKQESGQVEHAVEGIGQSFNPYRLDMGALHEEIADRRRQDAEDGRGDHSVLPSYTQLDTISGSNSPVEDVQPTPAPVALSHRRTLNLPVTPRLKLQGSKPELAVKVSASNHFDQASNYTDTAGAKTPPRQPRPDVHPVNPPTAKKRPAQSDDKLDYSPAALKSMSFSSLLNQPFDENARVPSPISTTPNLTTPESHLHALQTLSSVSPANRTAFFAAQTQSQWLDTTSFFEKRLGELFAELRTARSERRALTVKFEEEVRERMEEVQRCEKGIGDVLGDIRGRAKNVLPMGGEMS